MQIPFTYYGHSCFSLVLNNKTILFDPFITGNPLAGNIDINTIDADFILISHGHIDHILDAELIAKRTGAKIICSWEIHEWFNNKGITNTHPMNTGGEWTFDFGTIKCVVAQHSSGLPDGSYGGNPMGFIIFNEDKNIYYSGDTALTMDMQLIPLFAKIDMAILPIGNNFTMGYKDAAICMNFIKCQQAIGIHFDTFGFIEINHEDAMKHFKEAGFNLRLPKIGETFDI